MRLLVCLALLAVSYGVPLPEEEVPVIDPAPAPQQPLASPEQPSAPSEQPAAEVAPAEQPAAEAAPSQPPPPTSVVADGSDEDLDAFFWIFSAFADPLEVLDIIESPAAPPAPPAPPAAPAGHSSTAAPPRALLHLEGESVFVQFAD